MAASYDVIVVGGGILGLSTARSLLLERPDLRLALLEKEPELARHQSGHTSGVMHSGIYYAPGSLKAQLCVAGKRLLENYADEHGIARATRGKLIVALEESEFGRLAELERRGRANGVEGLRLLEGNALREVEPNVRGIRGLHAPTTGVIDYREVAASFAADVRDAGGSIELGVKVTALATRSGLVDLDTPGGSFTAGAVITCGGLQSDRLARLAGGKSARPRIVPFRGDYYTLGERAGSLVHGLVYPVPDPSFPFLGVHLTKGIDGTVVAGPNAVLALAREGYARTSFSREDAASTLGYPGFWRFAARHFRTGAAEAWRDISRRGFVRDIQRYVPAVSATDVRFGPSGIRAQALGRDGRLVDDFVFDGTDRVLHVVNAPSPAATSSLAIGAHIARLALEQVL
jgi:(S)-2-hydroxyglutarate dehydrogenase